ncbi:hypothetical protein EZI54_06495 [Marinobacter halodurans]|uniref:Uncharacterized protein n=1 Tax=Marinobacter halodurans TaxID=2528979 RepID=A0ABY1ZPU1_9GAMM|nr:hypothetical protein [Marinobacter halodurans]TBW57680.1 hypothetical protein EZI54_06495 [Marinobacter halodurans]
MTNADYLGTTQPRLVLYLPHRPNGLEQLAVDPNAGDLIAANSNHWRKIVTLLAKIASPTAGDWRAFRDTGLFRQTALCFAPELIDGHTWHWIGGKDNLLRFGTLVHNAEPLAGCPEVALDPGRKLLLTPYPDYRQLSNAVVGQIRAALSEQAFYER